MMFSESFKIFVLLSALFTGLSSHCFAQNETDSTTVITGTVFDSSGKPVELVNVQILGSFSGAVTGPDGHFSFTTRKTGTRILVASMIGFEQVSKKIEIIPGKKLFLQFTLKEEVVELNKLLVSASSFTTGKAKGVTLKPLEVVTTPGAAADLFRAVKTFPGVSTVDQGAGLFVRGGDVSETKILLDQATVVHPYRFESPTGGARGTIPPFLVSGTYFSTGGFPARYGNALSAVLAMESQGMPQSTTINLNLGMAVASAGLALPLIDDKLGMRFTGNRSFTQFLFEVNGQADEFRKAPVGLDGNLSLIYQPSNNTTFKFFNYASHSKIGVRAHVPSYDGLFKSKETNGLHNLQWQQFFEDWLMKTSFSMNRFESQREFGGFNLHQQDDTYKIRTDFESLFSGNIQIFTGGVWQYTENSFVGSVPVNENVIDPDASFTRLNEQFGAGRAGAYAEVKFRLFQNTVVNIGLRGDLQTKTNEIVFDPRLNLQYRFNKYTQLRFATGLYHQFPEPYRYNRETGNPGLNAQQAWHYILGFGHKKNLFHLRAEAYYKVYNDLVINANRSNLSNRGYGKAWGVDIFIKYSEFLKSRFNGWISYSFLQSDRYQSQNLGSEFTFRYAPSDFDITHNLSVTGKIRLVDMFYLGISYRFATGRPVTPIANAQFIEEMNYYQPVEGAVNSQRLPDFHRLDMNISYYWPFSVDKSVTFYAAVSNVLNHDNITGYTYNNNYSQRHPVVSSYSRAIYAGVSVNLGL